MTFLLPNQLRRAEPTLWLLAWSAALFGSGCAAATTNGAAAVRENSPEQATEDVRRSPSPVADDRHGASPEQVVELIAKPGLWPLEPDAAEERLRVLANVSRDVPAPEALSLVGGPSGAVSRFEVSYSRGDQGRWAFNVATFFLGGPDLRDLHRKVERSLIQHLGQAEWTEKGAAEVPSAGWNVGRDMSLLLAPSPNQGEQLLMISIAEPEGEVE